MKIVIIDDEPKTRNGLAKIIGAHAGWKITRSFDDALDAIDYLRDNPVDLVITDIRMPKMSGLDLIDALRGACPDTAFVVLSGYSLFEYAQRSIDLGVRKFLVKPVSPRELIETLMVIEKEMDGKQKPDTAPPIRTNNLIVQRAQEYLNLNYRSKCSLKDVAAALYISPNYLSSLFKDETGQNFSSYLMNIRLEKSLRYLRDVSYRISDIAALSGFTDYRYFCSVFRKKYGMTPVEYRNTKLTENR